MTFAETTVLEIREPTEDDYQDLCAYDCSICGDQLTPGAPLFVWGEPLGLNGASRYVAVNIFDSQDCASEAITAWTEKIGRDVLVVHRVR